VRHLSSSLLEVVVEFLVLDDVCADLGGVSELEVVYYCEGTINDCVA
jgi:hypothetical protein